jgi:hypothetical protein
MRGHLFERNAIGRKMVWSNVAILKSVRDLGIHDNARTISRFFYSPAVRQLWELEPE